MGKFFRRIKEHWRSIGPGLVAGAADNDPAGIATYTQVGAQFGLGQLWTAAFTLPILTAVQEACARIGLVTGKGLARIVREHHSHETLSFLVGILVVANTINIGADIGAMAEASRLIVPVPFIVLMFGIVAIILVLEVFISYRRYARILKWLSLISLSYVATVFIVNVPWRDAALATFIPHFEWSFAFLLLIAGNIGTTLAPYLFFWEESQEVEEDREHHLIHQDGTVDVTKHRVRRMRADNVIGMFASQLVTWAIILVAAIVLHGNGITDLKTAADAAQALEPLVKTFPYAGYFAKLLFALGIVSAGFLVVPVLSGSAAYALAQAASWKEGLNLKLRRAHGFYGVITIATLIGLLVNFLGIDLIKLLVYTSILNGVVAIPLLFIIGRIASNKKIMGDYASGKWSKFFFAIAFCVMLVIVIGALVTLFA